MSNTNIDHEKFIIIKKNELPDIKLPNSMYLVPDIDDSDFVEIHITTKDGKDSKRIITNRDINSKIKDIVDKKSEFNFVDDENGLNNIDTNKIKVAYVRDSGYMYIYDNKWIRVNNKQDKDIDFTAHYILAKS